MGNFEEFVCVELINIWLMQFFWQVYFIALCDVWAIYFIKRFLGPKNHINAINSPKKRIS